MHSWKRMFPFGGDNTGGHWERAQSTTKFRENRNSFLLLFLVIRKQMSGQRIKQRTSGLRFNFTTRKSSTVLVTSPMSSSLYNIGHKIREQRSGVCSPIWTYQALSKQAGKQRQSGDCCSRVRGWQTLNFKYMDDSKAKDMKPLFKRFWSNEKVTFS